jgi:hypothetical protein
MTAEGDHSPGTGPAAAGGNTNVASSELAPPGEPSGHPDRRSRPARPVGRFWWVLPYCAGALAVFLVAGLIIGLRYNSGPAQPAGLSSAEPMPAEMFPDALFGQLSADIQAGNETAFLGLASAAARPAITAWWDNLRAIGFTTGAVLPTDSLDAVHLDSHGNGTAVVLAGTHSPLDPVDDNGKPLIPMAHYRIGLHFASPGAIGQITSWQPLDDAPWDSGSPLYVRKAAYVVVAGPSGDRALVDQTLPAAETAAAYDIKMMGRVAAAFLQQHGFVVFVSGTAAVGNGWLATAPQPPGWPPQFLGARAVQLPGPGVSKDTAVRTGNSNLVNAISNDNMGGVRVALAPAGPATAGMPHDETVTLVGEFMLDILASHDEELSNGVPLRPVPSWTEQGLAVAVQALFETNPDPVPRRYSFATLTAGLRALPRSYRSGAYPSYSQLFGPSVTADEAWGEVAASTYEYIDSRYNITKMMVSAMVLWVGAPTPFGNVFKSGTNARNLVFFGIHSIRLGWRPWLARF